MISPFVVLVVTVLLPNLTLDIAAHQVGPEEGRTPMENCVYRAEQMLTAPGTFGHPDLARELKDRATLRDAACMEVRFGNPI